MMMTRRELQQQALDALIELTALDLSSGELVAGLKEGTPTPKADAAIQAIRAALAANDALEPMEFNLPQDALDRLLVGKATEGDQMLAYTAFATAFQDPRDAVVSFCGDSLRIEPGLMTQEDLRPIALAAVVPLGVEKSEVQDYLSAVSEAVALGENDRAQTLLGEILRKIAAAPTPQAARAAALTDWQRGSLVVKHLGLAALTGGQMSVYDAFLLGIKASEEAHGITAKSDEGGV